MNNHYAFILVGIIVMLIFFWRTIKSKNEDIKYFKAEAEYYRQELDSARTLKGETK